MEENSFYLNVVALNELANDMEALIRRRELLEETDPEAVNAADYYRQAREYVNDLRVMAIMFAMLFGGNSEEEQEP